MADRTVTVDFRMQGLDKAAQDADRLAGSLKGVSGAAGVAQRSFAGAGGARGRAAGIDTPLTDVIARRYEDMLDPSRGVRGGADDGGLGNGMGGRAGLGLGRRWQSQALTIFGISAGAQAFEGVGKGLAEIAGNATSSSEAFGMLGRHLTDQVPIVGHLTRAFIDMGDAISGQTSRIVALGNFLQAAGRQQAFAGFAAGQQFTGAQARFGASRQLEDLIGAAGGAQGYLESLTPDRLAGYQERGWTGDLLTHVNDAKRVRDRAAAAEAAGTGLAGRRAADLAASQGNLGQLDARAGQLRQDILRLIRRASVAEQMKAGGETSDIGDIYGGGGSLLQAGRGYGREPVLAQELRGQAGVLAGQLEQNQAARARELEQIQRRITELDAARADSAKLILERKKAEIDVDRARLAVQEGQIGNLKRGAVRGGLQTEAENQADLELARYGRNNFGALTREQQQALVSNPLYGDFFTREAERIGRASPAIQAASVEFGGGKTLEQAETEQARIIADLDKRLAGIQAEAAKAQADSFAANFEKFLDAINKGIEAKINEKANDIEAKRLREQAQAKQ